MVRDTEKRRKKRRLKRSKTIEMLRTIIITILLLGYSSFADARQPRVFSTKIFKPNVYIGANTGFNVYVGEVYKSYLFSNPLSATGIIERATIGYNITKVLGVRSFIGYTNHKWPYIDTLTLNNKTSKFSAAHLTIDLTYNLSNRIASYNLNRPLDISLFAGVGVSRSLLADIPTDPISVMVHGGLQVDYRLTQFLELNLIGDMNIVPDNYNGSGNNGTPPFDLYPSLSIGITYHFRKKQHCNCE